RRSAGPGCGGRRSTARGRAAGPGGSGRRRAHHDPARPACPRLAGSGRGSGAVGAGYVAGVTDPVQLSIEDGVAVGRLDDGKANAVSHRLLEQLHQALDTAEAEATAVALIGREGKFSAGFDLSVMTQGAEA